MSGSGSLKTNAVPGVWQTGQRVGRSAPHWGQVGQEGSLMETEDIPGSDGQVTRLEAEILATDGGLS
ncbi:MAG TPA: hypothetical protein DCY79_09025 [Planctomycetaceae bacterium]|nr:hypothetical protein [Blastopirellula sp.]HAY79932.1 hypothetical protein [Planctomycetaceae bacterium]